MTFTMKRRLLGLIGVALLVYTVLWFLAALQGRNHVVRLINEMNASGNVKLEYKHINLAGYPLNITLRISKPVFTVDYTKFMPTTMPAVPVAQSQQITATQPGSKGKVKSKPLVPASVPTTKVDLGKFEHVMQSSNPLILHADLLGRSYSMDLPYDMLSTLTADDTVLHARLDYRKARVSLSFRKQEMKRGMIQYFSQFSLLSEWWRYVKVMKVDIEELLMYEQAGNNPIYGASSIVAKGKFFKTKEDGLRVEGSYSGQQSHADQSFKDYVVALQKQKAVARYAGGNTLLRALFADMMLWPEAGKTKREFDFVIEKNGSNGAVGLEVRKYGAQDLLSSSSMDLSLMYYGQGEAGKAKKGVKMIGSYAVHYQPEWYVVAALHDYAADAIASTQAAAKSMSVSAAAVRNYMLPKLHEFEYLLADFDVDFRSSKAENGPLAILPTSISLRTDKYTVSLKGGVFYTDDPHFKGKAEITLYNYPVMMDDLAVYLTRLEGESLSIEPWMNTVPAAALLALVKEAANSSDELRALFYLHKGSNGALMFGKRSLAELLG